MALVQTANTGSGSGSLTIFTAFTSAQTAGNLNYVVVTYGDSNASTVPSDTCTVSDSANGSYTAVSAATKFTGGASGGACVQVFYRANIAAALAGANTVSVVRGGSGA